MTRRRRHRPPCLAVGGGLSSAHVLGLRIKKPRASGVSDRTGPGAGGKRINPPMPFLGPWLRREGQWVCDPHPPTPRGPRNASRGIYGDCRGIGRRRRVQGEMKSRRRSRRGRMPNLTRGETVPSGRFPSGERAIHPPGKYPHVLQIVIAIGVHAVDAEALARPSPHPVRYGRHRPSEKLGSRHRDPDVAIRRKPGVSAARSPVNLQPHLDRSARGSQQIRTVLSRPARSAVRVTSTAAAHAWRRPGPTWA